MFGGLAANINAPAGDLEPCLPLACSPRTIPNNQSREYSMKRPDMASIFSFPGFSYTAVMR